MSSATIELSPVPRMRLKTFVDSVGTFHWDDPRRAEPLVKNLCGTLTKEPKLLSIGLKAGIPSKLRDTFNTWVDYPHAICLASVAHSLSKSRRMSRSEAGWTVETIAAGMGLIPARAESLITDDLLRSDPLPKTPPPLPNGYAFRAGQSDSDGVGRSSDESAAACGPAYKSSVLDLTPERDAVINCSSSTSQDDSEWCWPAFFGGAAWIWANGMPAFAAAYVLLFATAAAAHLYYLVPILLLGFHGFLGIQGYQLARSRPAYTTRAQYDRVQRMCLLAGALVFFLEIGVAAHGTMALHAGAGTKLAMAGSAAMSNDSNSDRLSGDMIGGAPTAH